MKREIVLGTLNQLKQANCHTLISAMNGYWTPAAFGKASLDSNAMVLFAQAIKDNARSMIKICQAQDGYVAWREVKKRRKCHVEPVDAKRRKVAAAVVNNLDGDRDRL